MCRLYINLAWLSVRLYPINFKTGEPIGPKKKFSLFFNVRMRKCSQLKKKMDAKRPKKPSITVERY